MGAALKALADVGKLLRHNPIILAVGVIAFVLLSIVNFVLGLIPLIGSLMSAIVYPIFVAGLLAIIYAGRDGNAGVGDFFEGIAENYLPLLAAYILLTIPVVLLGIVLLVGFLFLFSANPEALVSSIEIVGVIAVGIGLFVGLCWLAIQFFDVAIVAGNGIRSSFGTSVSMAVGAPLSTVGFTVLKLLLGTVIVAIPVAPVFLLSAVSIESVSASPSTALLTNVSLLVGLLAYVFLALPLSRVLTRTYHVAYFNRRQAQQA